MFMGANNDQGGPAANRLDVDDALAAVENFQRRAADLRERLKDPASTKFVVVSIPTILSARESRRLMGELGDQGICVSDLVVNQCVGGGAGAGAGASDAMKRYYDRRVEGQRRWISELRDVCAGVSASPEYRGNAPDPGDISGIAVAEVPFYDMELVGAPALGYVGAQTFGGDSFGRLVGFDADDNDPKSNNPKIVICGGKGGVGKTTTGASLAITMASAGHNVAVVSTDPAHSLGDALDMNLQGGSLVDVPLFGVPPATGALGDEGSLTAMEIDPTSALKEFRDSIDKLIGKKDDANGGSSELSSTLRSLGEIIDALPAGTDEVVALGKVIQLIRRNKFDRVVLDTAPTGHTLRMLTTPSFLADLIENVLTVSRKMNSNAAVKMLLAGAARSGGYDPDDAVEAAESALLKFQVSMFDLEDLFADPSSTEFLIVTIGTELAVRESARLLNDLTFGDPDMPVRVRNVVVNQVLDGGEGDDGGDERLLGFATRLAKSQSSSIEELRRVVDQSESPPRVTTVTMLDTEPRGVYGLKALSEQLLAKQAEVSR